MRLTMKSLVMDVVLSIRSISAVSMSVGAIALTRTLRSRHSSASPRVSCMTPPLDCR